MLACSFSADSILADPTGQLTQVHETVARHYRESQWVLARCENAKKDVLDQWLPWMIQSESLCQAVFDFAMTVMEIALIPVLADLRPPTVRQALVVAQHVLRQHGQLSLYEDLLALVGSAALTEPEMLEVLRGYEAAFDQATHVFRTPFWGQSGVGAAARPIFIDGTRDLIDRGYWREAAWFALGGHSLSQTAIENDVPEEKKAQYREQYGCFLARWGIRSTQDLRDRAEPARQLLCRSMQVGNRICAGNAASEQ